MLEPTPVSTLEGITLKAIEAYRADGFIHVPNVLAPGEVAEFLSEARDLLGRETTVAWNEEAGSVMDWVVDPEIKSTAMRRVVLHPRITKIAESLAGVPLRLFKAELLRKRTSDSTVTPAHIDAPAFPFRGAPVTLTAWVALVDVPVERGAMTFVPGSHRLTGAVGDFTSNPLELPEVAWRPRVTVPIRAGDVTFHHERTAHLAGANRTDIDRISMATVYMDASATFDPKGMASYLQGDITGLGPAVLKEFEPGQPLDHARFPLASSR